MKSDIFTYKAKRALCGLCALAVLSTSVLMPIAYAAETDADVSCETLTAAEARQMQSVDAAVTELKNGDDYAAMTEAERAAAAEASLEELAAQGLVRGSSIYVDEENGLVTFTYACGAVGGITFAEHEDEEPQSFVLPSAEALAEENGLLELSGQRYEFLGNAIVYYAYDNLVNSTRYPYYAYMQAFWTTLGLTTQMNTSVTVADMRGMDKYNLCIISAHGTQFTYTSGFIFTQERTEPVIMLLEKSTFLKDLLYGFDLLSGRVIKVDGCYCLTPDFFSSAYSDGSLSDTIVISETCNFFGTDRMESSSMANAMLEGGAKAVLGYINKVYTVYSRLIVWDVVNHLIIGQTIGQATDHATSVYGDDDIIWFYSNGGKKAHVSASYPIIYGDLNANLPAAAYLASTVAQEVEAQSLTAA